MNNYSVLLDVIILLIAVVIIISSYRKGFVRSIIMLAGYIASIFAAIWLSKVLSAYIFDNYMHDAIIKNIEQTISQSAKGSSFAAVLTSIFDKLPSVIVAPLLASFGGEEKIIAKLQESTGGAVSKLSSTVSDTVVAPIVTVLLQMFFCLLIFTVCVIIVKMISSLFKGFYSIPVLGPINSILGAGIGVLKAGIVIYVLAIAAYIVISLTGNHLPWLNTNIINKSILFKEFYNFAT